MNRQVNVPRLVRKVRKRFGLTQQDLAGRLGVALPTVSRWENRRCNASPLALDKIEADLKEIEQEIADILAEVTD